ncbi:unnamed protein product [Schistosoma turkestanicum]|nr:unnamed protein product [Schistosoma turkestanicum]
MDWIDASSLSLSPLLLTVLLIFILYTTTTRYLGRLEVERIRFTDNQSVIIDEKTGLRASVRKLSVSEVEKLNSPFDAFKSGLRKSKDKSCFGIRQSFNSPIKWITYKEVYEKIQLFGSAVTILMKENSMSNFIGIYGRNSPEWVITQLASAAYSFVIVPLYCTFGDEAIVHVSNETELKIIVCDTVSQACHLYKINSEKVEVFIIMKPDSTFESIKKELSNKVHLFTFEEILEKGRSNRLPEKVPDANDLFMIIYTSGSLGLPKGAMITNEAYLNAIKLTVSLAEENHFSKEDLTHVSFLPLSHVMEQLTMVLALFVGGRIGFLTDGIESLFDDLRDFKPSFFCSVPRLLVRIYMKFSERLHSKPIIWKICQYEINKRMEEQKHGIYRRNGIIDFLFFREFRELLGGRVQAIISGSSPIDRDVLFFIRAVLSCPVIEVYGSTETLGLVSSTMFEDVDAYHVGAIFPGVQIKLIDVPEMGILVSKDQMGEVLNKEQRRLLSKQFRIQKRLEVKKLEASRGTKENPIACVLIPLSSSVPTHLAQLLFQTCEPNIEVIRKPEYCLQNVVTIHSQTLNKYFSLICAYSDDLFGCLDLANFADWLILLVPSNPSEIPDSAHELLVAIYAQGFTNASYAVLSSSSNFKELKKILECRFPTPESMIHQLNSSSNALNLLRHIASTNPSSFHVKAKNTKLAGQSTVAHTGARYRTRLLVDSIDLISENDAHDDISKSEVTVCLRGRLHGAPLFLFEELEQNGSVPVGPRVHLTGWGDFPLMEAKWIDNDNSQKTWKTSDLNVFKNLLTKRLPQSSSVNLPNENENCEDDSLSDKMSIDSHQSINKNDWDAVEQTSEHLESELSDDFTEECGSIASHTAHTMAASATSAFSSAQLAKFRAARMEEMFPDEVETPLNIRASERFLKYCSLPRFQGSVWPTEKNWLPKYYQNIACFKNYHRNRRTVIRYIEQKLADVQSAYKLTEPVLKYIPPGVDVELRLQPVSRDLGESILSYHTFPQSDETRKPSDPKPHPLLVWSLLPHETQMSVCHFTMFRRASAIHAVSDLMVIANAANKITESSSKENGSCALEFGEEASTQVEREDKAIHDALISHRNKIDRKHNEKALYDPKMPIPLEAEPIKSKDLMLIQAGIRRFVAAPIYSTASNPQEKSKFEPFFPASESSAVASVYAPVMYSPVNVLQFRIRVTENEDGEISSPYVGELVATGSLKSVDPSHLIIKRIFLSGHPYKINRRHVVVRYMFHNPADVLHFQSVQLQTKSGAVGHIKEPVGTHGHMKCVFNRPILANDVVLMPLYKRVFPKYVYEPVAPKYLAGNGRNNDLVITDSDHSRYVSSDVIQLRRKSIPCLSHEKMDQDLSTLLA